MVISQRRGGSLVIKAGALVDKAGSFIQIKQRSLLVYEVVSAAIDATGRTVIVEIQNHEHGIREKIAMPKGHGVTLVEG